MRLPRLDARRRREGGEREKGEEKRRMRKRKGETGGGGGGGGVGPTEAHGWEKFLRDIHIQTRGVLVKAGVPGCVAHIRYYPNKQTHTH